MRAPAHYAGRTGFAPHDVVWYQGWGAFKLAVILQQIYTRWLRGQTQDACFADMGRRVASQIDKARAIAGRQDPYP